MVKYPITPAANAMHSPAMKAFVMNGVVSVSIQFGSKLKSMLVMEGPCSDD